MMLGEFKYVVMFSNGKYYAGENFEDKETDDLKHAAKYVFDWSPMKDVWLRYYSDSKKITYKVIEIKTTTTYEIVERQGL